MPSGASSRSTMPSTWTSMQVGSRVGSNPPGEPRCSANRRVAQHPAVHYEPGALAPGGALRRWHAGGTIRHPSTAPVWPTHITSLLLPGTVFVSEVQLLRMGNRPPGAYYHVEHAAPLFNLPGSAAS